MKSRVMCCFGCNHLPKVRLASPFPTMGRNNTLPLIWYLPVIAKRFDRPITSNLDLFGSRPKPLKWMQSWNSHLPWMFWINSSPHSTYTTLVTVKSLMPVNVILRKSRLIFTGLSSLWATLNLSSFSGSIGIRLMSSFPAK